MVTDEAKLLDRAVRGDEQAFLALYVRHRVPVLRFAWRMTGSVAVAEDVAQECFLSLVRGSHYREDRGQLRTYLLGIARHLVFRHLRMSERETEEHFERVAGPDVLDALLNAERSEMVRQAIASLPAVQREAIVLFEYEQLALEEIAAITGAEVGAIKGRLRRARESLRKRLEPLLGIERKSR